MTLVLKTMKSPNKVPMGRRMIKSGSDYVALSCGKRTRVKRVGLRDAPRVSLTPQGPIAQKNPARGAECPGRCHLEILNITFKFVL